MRGKPPLLDGGRTIKNGYEAYWHPEHFPIKVYIDTRDPIEFQEGMETAASIWNLTLGLDLFEPVKVDFGKTTVTGSCGWVASQVVHDLSTSGLWRGEYYPGTSEICFGWVYIQPDIKKNNIIKIFIHELGHSLGLAHDEGDKRSIMYPKVYSDYPQYIMPDDGHSVINMAAGDFLPLPKGTRSALQYFIQSL
jgi:hypothetical protein